MPDLPHANPLSLWRLEIAATRYLSKTHIHQLVQFIQLVSFIQPVYPMIIGLIGRTNVGKSTLFNELIGSHRAIVTDISGTTRELLVEHTNFRNLPDTDVTIIDSPGLDSFDEEIPFIDQIIEEADILVFVVDGKAELGEQEYRIYDMILASGKAPRTILAVNKLDGKVYGPEQDLLIADFYALGCGHVMPVSAMQGTGVEEIGELAIEIYQETFPSQREGLGESPSLSRKDDTKNTNIVIIGRPNVGKSTLLNTLVGETVSHVQDEPGTTLDYIHTTFERNGQPFHLYDTAGIRKKKKIVGLERIAYAKTTRMVDYIQPTIIFLIDIVEGMTHRDKTLLGEMIHKGLPVILAINKIDQMSPKESDQAISRMKLHLGFDRIPAVKISAQDAIGLPKLMQTIVDVSTAAHTYIPTAELNKLLQRARLTNPPTFPKNKICKRKYVTQIGAYPPTFMLSVNNKEYANFSFTRWIEKHIRKAYEFTGVPIKIKYKSKVEENPYLKKNKGK